MKNKKYPAIAFILIFIVHAVYSVYGYWRVAQLWVDAKINNTLLLSYFSSNDYLLGFSYALAGAFTVYSIARYFAGHKNAGKGAVGGLALSGFLYFGGCFLIGCCGSPMLAVYLSLFGSKFLGFTKPLIAVITVVMVVISYFWLNKKNNSCCDNNSCSIRK